MQGTYLSLEIHYGLISCVHTRALSFPRGAEEYKLRRCTFWILILSWNRRRRASSSSIIQDGTRRRREFFIPRRAPAIPSRIYSRRRRRPRVCRRIISYFACQSHDLHYAVVFYEWGLCHEAGRWFSTAAVRLYAVCFAVTSAFYNSYFSLRTNKTLDRAALWRSKFN